MNRRELLKNASRLLGLAAIAPFIPKIEDNELEFENEPNYHEIVTDDLDREGAALKGIYFTEPSIRSVEVPYFNPTGSYQWLPSDVCKCKECEEYRKEEK